MLFTNCVPDTLKLKKGSRKKIKLHFLTQVYFPKEKKDLSKFVLSQRKKKKKKETWTVIKWNIF